MNLSIVIPAHNEEQFIGVCIKSIFEHCTHFKINPEVIVVLNRCTDRTGEIAGRLGAKLISDDSRNLAKIRNAGIKNAKGDIIITMRKFDTYGDWYFFRLLTTKQNAIRDSITGKDMSFVNEHFYDFNKKSPID
jgi:glycosyltransferase involved in cell wall biosynthesis